MKKKKEELYDEELEKELEEHFKKPRTPIYVLIINFLFVIFTMAISLGVFYVIDKITGLFILALVFWCMTFYGIVVLVGPLIIKINNNW